MDTPQVRTFLGGLAVSLVFIVGCVAGAVGVSGAHAEATESSLASSGSGNAQLWEYMVASHPAANSAGLTQEYGVQGWELVAVDETRLFFKRPL